MKSRKVLTALLALWFFLLNVLPAFAASEMEKKQEELNQAQHNVQVAEEKKDQAKQKVAEAKESLGEIVAKLSRLQKDIDVLQKKADALQKDIDKNTAELNKKKEEMEGRMEIYRHRLRDIYENGQINYLDVLLGAKDFGDFASRMYLLQKIIRSDLDLIAVIEQEAGEIQKRQDQLDAQMAEIKKDRAALEQKRSDAENMRQQRAQKLYMAEEEKRKSDEEYDRMLAISDNIKAMLQGMEAASQMPSGGGNGSFVWPCSGPITSYYGWRVHPIFGTRKYHSGMDIAVDYGTPIHAAATGVVVYSGWMGGYGYAIMIDHGGGLVTIYGHNSSLAVSEGQRVSQGQLVAYAGSTGYSTGPHCHFEVRLHGEVTEPLNYLP
ncbi:MAG: peptidoglycan DD-metalloendopeptidase family protein [Acidaminococcaceae bacterium]|nr:peptidoglycan DD-metalloendopeptidase family protein [Acidaminococcaceae bacterium]